MKIDLADLGQPARDINTVKHAVAVLELNRMFLFRFIKVFSLTKLFCLSQIVLALR